MWAFVGRLKLLLICFRIFQPNKILGVFDSRNVKNFMKVETQKFLPKTWGLRIPSLIIH